MATCDRTNWLSCTLRRFKINPSRIWLPADISLEYREHIKNLVRTYERDEHGNPEAVYVATGPDHFCHSLVYADIALTFAAGIGGGGHWKSVLMAEALNHSSALTATPTPWNEPVYRQRILLLRSKEDSETKLCTRCFDIKPLTAFTKMSSGRKGCSSVLSPL